MRTITFVEKLLIVGLIGTAAYAGTSSAQAQDRRQPPERIDLPGVWRCMTPQGRVGSLSVTGQNFVLDGFSATYSVSGNTLTATAGGVTTLYHVRQFGNHLTLVGPNGRYGCQRGGTGPLT